MVLKIWHLRISRLFLAKSGAAKRPYLQLEDQVALCLQCQIITPLASPRLDEARIITEQQ